MSFCEGNKFNPERIGIKKVLKVAHWFLLKNTQWNQMIYSLLDFDVIHRKWSTLCITKS